MADAKQIVKQLFEEPWKGNLDVIDEYVAPESGQAVFALGIGEQDVELGLTGSGAHVAVRSGRSDAIRR